MLRFVLIIFFIGYSLPAWADYTHDAFTYANRKDWPDARAEAEKSGNPVLLKLITWEYLLNPDSRAGFDEIASFIKDDPDWPDQKRLRIRAELALACSNVPDEDIIRWFGSSTPITGVGKIALAEAYNRTGKASRNDILRLVRDAWRDGDFDEAQEKAILKAHGKSLRREDDIARADRLLWEGKIAPVKWMMPRLPRDYQKLYKARMALIEDKRIASVIDVLRVPKTLKSDPGLIYDRMYFRLKRGDDKGVREMLLEAPAHVPYPEKWWKIRAVQVRKAIGEKHYSLAGRLLANHGQIDGSEYAEAMWLQGWLNNEFLNRPEKAYRIFERIYNSVRFPVSRARAAYWAGRSQEKSGDENAAKNWYERAAAYPTTFYGQLASLKIHGAASLQLPSLPSLSDADRRDFDDDDLVQAVRLCVEQNDIALARRLISYLVENAENDTDIALATELGDRLGNPSLSVHAAKKALQQNVVMIDAGYPLPPTPASLPIERALALAIIRQESEFDDKAHSPSGALGMMQILPSTARETARKNGIRTWLSRLFEPEHNVTLGSHYLARLINAYDGSWIMAIAAYNAGPGNVHRWEKTFGTPNHDADAAIDWIEKIPYDETRNYVQRVLENVQVYRCIERGGESHELKLAEDLMR